MNTYAKLRLENDAFRCVIRHMSDEELEKMLQRLLDDNLDRAVPNAIQMIRGTISNRKMV